MACDAADERFMLTVGIELFADVDGSNMRNDCTLIE
jgi:hypothetical protein